ncbi:MAG: YncE family protein [Bryobacteraceae bacterium]
MRKLLTFFAALASVARGGLLYLGAYPNSVLIFDEGKGEIIDRIPLETGLPTGLRLSYDRKKIFVTTNDHSGVEIIDIATRKVLSHFVLNNDTKRYRFFGGAPDPSDKLLYTTTTEITKGIDRYEVGKPKYTVIDLAQQKIVRTVELAPEDLNAGGGGRAGGNFEVSPDGKYLYQFRDKVVILNTADFKVVDRIDLSKPELPTLETVSFGGMLDSIWQPGQHISVFNSTDPVVHNRLFGIARFDLASREVEYSPIGPSPAGMSGLHVTPDKKTAYTLVSNGTHGNKRCEMWAFDLGSNKLVRSAEVPCRSRCSFGMSADGKKLYIYGAGFEIEVYDAATLKYERTWDLNNDVTMAGMVVLPTN